MWWIAASARDVKPAGQFCGVEARWGVIYTRKHTYACMHARNAPEEPLEGELLEEGELAGHADAVGARAQHQHVRALVAQGAAVGDGLEEQRVAQGLRATLELLLAGLALGWGGVCV
jgi:hypothetical protein